MTRDTVGDLARLVGGEVVGDPSVEIDGIGDLRAAGPSQLGFLRNPSMLELAVRSSAGAVLVTERFELPMSQIIVTSPDASFARIASHFHPVPRATEHHVHPSAVVADDAVLEEPVHIGPQAVVGARTRIGAGTMIGAGVVIGAGVQIGRDCTVYPRVVLYDGCRIGDRVILHAGAVLGSDGFGYAKDGVEWVKVPHVGRLVVEDDVEIGANSTIDRATLGATRIGRGTKLDNLVHVGHNCVFGEHCAVAALSAFSGSTVFGDRVIVGGHVVSAGHNKICDDARIGGTTVLHHDITEPDDYIGWPIQRGKRNYLRMMRGIADVGDLQAEVRKLQREVRRNEE